jgi:hypothetical protein
MADETAKGRPADQPQPTPNLPMVIEPPSPHTGFARYGLPASFITQLIAEREQFAVQRKLRRSGTDKALVAYSDGAKSRVRQMPKGYRHSETA